jgi:hypothetical protein
MFPNFQGALWLPTNLHEGALEVNIFVFHAR